MLPICLWPVDRIMPGGSNLAGTLISLHHRSELPVFRRTNPAWRSLGVDEAPADAGSARVGSRLVEIRPVSGRTHQCCLAMLWPHTAPVGWDGRTLQLPQDGPIRPADCLPEVRARNACRRDRLFTAASERTGVRELDPHGPDMLPLGSVGGSMASSAHGNLRQVPHPPRSKRTDLA